MRRALFVDIDTDRKDQIRIGRLKLFHNEVIINDPVTDMTVLCEALGAVIRIAHNYGIKDQCDSQRDCIRHLNSCFVNEDLKVRMEAP